MKKVIETYHCDKCDKQVNSQDELRDILIKGDDCIITTGNKSGANELCNDCTKEFVLFFKNFFPVKDKHNPFLNSIK